MATRSVPQLSLEAAQIASNAAQEKAKQLGIGKKSSHHHHHHHPPSSSLTSLPIPDFNIALVDSTLHLLHFTRMPTAKLTSISIAINKAFTAAGHRIPTSAYTTGAAAKNFAPGGVAYGIHNSNDGRFTLIGGGVPIEIEGQVVGAIGVSTGTPGQDEEVARAGVEAVGRWVKRKEGSKL